MRTGSSPTPRSATSARRGTSRAWTAPLSMRGATKDRAQVTVNVFPSEMSFCLPPSVWFGVFFSSNSLSQSFGES